MSQDRMQLFAVLLIVAHLGQFAIGQSNICWPDICWPKLVSDIQKDVADLKAQSPAINTSSILNIN